MLRRFWSDTTSIPLTQVFRAYADARTKGRATQRPQYRGVCAIMYLNTTLQYRLQAIGESAMQHAAQENSFDDGVGEGLVAEPSMAYRVNRIRQFIEGKSLVEQEGIEPSASGLPAPRSPN